MKLNKDKLIMMSGALLLTLTLTTFGGNHALTANANADTQAIDENQPSESFDGDIEDLDVIEGLAVEVTIVDRLYEVDDDGNEVLVEENRYTVDENGNEILVDGNGSESTED